MVLRDIPGLEGRYAASSDGRIWSHKRGRFRKPVFIRGYAAVGIRQGNKQVLLTVHRLVAKTWIPNPQMLPNVNHIDGDKKNSHHSNLEWCTPRHNAIHAWRTGLMVRNSSHSDGLQRAGAVSAARRRKLTIQQLGTARARIAAGEQQQVIAREFGVSKSTLSTAIRGLTKGYR